MKTLLKVLKFAAKPNLLERTEQVMLRRIIASPQFAAKFYPYEKGCRHYILPKVRHELPKNESDLPIPPQEFWLGYGKTPEQYLALGRKHIGKMKEILEASAFSLGEASRVLDFGCGSGIMMRWLYDFARAGEVWGVDLVGDLIVWCQQHLSPPFKFVTTTSYPHLPFEDHYFDLIYAGSVFTHISDLAEAWLLELKRIVRPGGRLYLTVQDNTTVRKFLTDNRPREERHPVFCHLEAFEQKTHFTASDFAMFAINRAPGPGFPGQAQVFYDIDYLQQHWGNYVEIISIHPEAYGFQTAILIKK
jgi:ubiquinone/menaquinone biosynthesis C-methylase UbiE